jgi:glutathione S-transferase
MIAWASFNFYRDWGYNLAYPQLFPHHKRPTEEGHRVAVEWGRDKSAFWLQVLDEHWFGDGRTWITGDTITVADYFAGGLVALGDIIRWDFSGTPRVAAWLDRVKALPHWAEASSALDGFADSVKEMEFVRG